LSVIGIRTTRSAPADWVSVRVWEHEDPTDAAERVASIVRSRRGG